MTGLKTEIVHVLFHIFGRLRTFLKLKLVNRLYRTCQLNPPTQKKILETLRTSQFFIVSFPLYQMTTIRKKQNFVILSGTYLP